MLKPYYAVFALCGLLLFASQACRNDSTRQASQESNVGKIDTTLVAIPDPVDLLEILRGNWQSVSDSTYQINIAESVLTHLYKGQIRQKNAIEIDASCGAGTCSTSDGTADGWCIVEKKPAGDQCMLVLRCDKKMLHLRPLDGSGTELTFKKL